VLIVLVEALRHFVSGAYPNFDGTTMMLSYVAADVGASQVARRA
jgi:hypothetical protein